MHKLPNYFIPNNNLISSIRKKGTPDETIGRKDTRDEAKSLLKIRSDPLHYIFRGFATNYSIRTWLPEIYEPLMGMVYDSTTFSEEFLNLMANVFRSHINRIDQEVLNEIKCFHRLLYMNKYGQDCGPKYFEKAHKSTANMQSRLTQQRRF